MATSEAAADGARVSGKVSFSGGLVGSSHGHGAQGGTE